MIFDPFTTREIATAIYILILGIIAISSKKVRRSAINVIKAALSFRLVVPFCIMLAYACLLVLLFSKLSFWKGVFLKDISIWVLFAGVPMCYKAINHKEKHFFRNSLLDNLKFTAIVEFITGTFTFSFVVELILQPVIAFLFLLQEVSKRDEKNAPVTKAIGTVLAFGGICLLYATIKQAIAEYTQLSAVDLLVSFSIPIVFSLLYLPFAYCFAVYAKYEETFMRMDFFTEEDRSIRKRHKYAVFKACGISYQQIYRFQKEYLNHLYRSMPEKDFCELIRLFLNKELPE